jgi:hypothetical protein
MKKALEDLYRKIRSKFSRPFDSDIYIISYPKSGRTWLRTLIGKYLSLKYNFPESKILATDSLPISGGLPKVSFTHDDSGMKDKTRYDKLSRDRRKYSNKKVVLMGRDIKDTLVSAYFQATKRRNVFEGTISDFIATKEFGIHKILTFYDIWLRNQLVPKAFLFIRYEDLHRDTREILVKVLNFIGEATVDENLIEQSIEYCSFENLKKLEARNQFRNRVLKPTNKSDPESFKVRKGKVGGYTQYLSEEDVAFIDKTIEAYRLDFTKFNKV